MKKYYLKNKTYGTYYKSRYFKGNFHYVLKKEEATILTRKEIKELLNELNHPENFEIKEAKV